MPAPAVSPNDLTRQQLDELDALLQRMLSLPLNKPAEAAPPSRLPDPPVPDPVPPRPVPRTDPPASVRTPHLPIPPSRPEPVVMAATVPAVAVAEMRSFTPPAPKAFDFPSPARLFGPPTPDTGVLPPTEKVAPFDPVSVSLPSPVEDDSDAVVLTPIEPATPTPGVPIAHWPLFGINWLLEQILGLFGPPGRAVCSPAGKMVVGWAGVLLLFAAGVWAARGMGWLQFSWPR
ncbi:MAG TPA: hypothetical protein VGJ05_08460 [Fimbriiglobus sp.]|jgi:hypothetical protein